MRSDREKLKDVLAVSQAVAVEGTDEVVSAAEIAASEAALQDYCAGRDRGMTATGLKQRLFGGEGG